LTSSGFTGKLCPMLKAVYPGSFDPPTNGHLNIIQRAAKICDELLVIIAVNIAKGYYFSSEERYEMMKEMLSDMPNVTVHLWDKLIVDFVKKNNAKMIIRGVRALADFEHEFELSMINKALDPSIETILIPTDPKYFVLRSSAIKEIAALGGEFKDLVPDVVAKALIERIRSS
jgi:pantetheine-phosphate adenylyltransferase